MKLIRTRLRYDVDRSAALLAALGIVQPGLNLELLNRIGGRDGDAGLIRSVVKSLRHRIVSVHPVHHDVVIPITSTVCGDVYAVATQSAGIDHTGGHTRRQR